MINDPTEMPDISPNIWLDANFIEEYDFIDDVEAEDFDCIDDIEPGE